MEKTYKVKTLHATGQNQFVFEMPISASLLRFSIDSNRFMLTMMSNQLNTTILDDGSSPSIRTFMLMDNGFEYKDKEPLFAVGMVQGYYVMEVGKPKLIKPKEEMKEKETK